jgi:hypothetical protein
MKKFIQSIIVTLAVVLTFNSNANATWDYYNNLVECKNYVESWKLALANDTDGVFGPEDADRIKTIDGSFTLYDRVDFNSDFNIISVSIPTYFYGLAGNLSYPTMYVTITSLHESDWTQDFYFHSNAITIHPDDIGGDTAFYTIGVVIDGNSGGATQAPIPVAHRAVTVEIEIVGPEGVQHLVDQVRINTNRKMYDEEGGCLAH